MLPAPKTQTGVLMSCREEVWCLEPNGLAPLHTLAGYPHPRFDERAGTGLRLARICRAVKE